MLAQGMSADDISEAYLKKYNVVVERFRKEGKDI